MVNTHTRSAEGSHFSAFHLIVHNIIFQLCQFNTETMNYFSLGTYTNFQWIITEFNPLEFQINYDGGTEVIGIRRYVSKFKYVKRR